MGKIATENKIYTYEDYTKLPEGAPYQLIGGELVMVPAPTPYHQYVSGNIYVLIWDLVNKHDLGQVYFAPIDVYFEETETYQPDIIFISKDRLNIISKEKVEGAPDLVIEILSPTTAYYDLKKKSKVYEKHVVKEYWIVDPGEKGIEVYVYREGKLVLDQKVDKEGKIKSKILPGFTVDLKGIF